MSDRKKIRAVAAENPKRDLAQLGIGKGWYKSWRVLMDVMLAKDPAQFTALEPRVNRALSSFGFWITRLKQDPRRHMDPDGTHVDLVRDRDFGLAYAMLGAEAIRIILTRAQICPGQERIAHDIEAVAGKIAYCRK